MAKGRMLDSTVKDGMSSNLGYMPEIMKGVAPMPNMSNSRNSGVDNAQRHIAQSNIKQDSIAPVVALDGTSSRVLDKGQKPSKRFPVGEYAYIGTISGDEK